MSSICSIRCETSQSAGTEITALLDEDGRLTNSCIVAMVILDHVFASTAGKPQRPKWFTRTYFLDTCILVPPLSIVGFFFFTIA